MPGVKSVERALSILDAVGEKPGGLVDVSGRVKLPTSTTSRLLGTLEQHGAVSRDARGVYRIGPSIVSIAGPAAGSDVRAIARRHMSKLADELGEAVALSIPSGTSTTTVDQVDGPKPVRVEDWTGTEVPIHAGCSGLVTMAFWSDEEVDEYLSKPLTKCTERTILVPSVIRKRLELLRNGKTFWTNGEFVDELSSVAAPILNELGNAVAALYTYGPTYRYPTTAKTGVGSASWVANRVAHVALDISEDLGYVEPAVHAKQSVG